MSIKVIEAFASLGVGKGDILYVASDVTTFVMDAMQDGKSIDECLGELVDGLQELVGESGTLMFPIYSWAFNNGEIFDIRHSTGSTGALANWILKNRPEFSRTAHPIYSLMVWGKDAKMLANLNNINAFGSYSPFGYMYKFDAKMAFFNVAINMGITFTHYVEEALQVPYRYFKPFTAGYIDANGVETKRTYVMYVRAAEVNSKKNMPNSFYESILKEAKFDNYYIKLLGSCDTFRITANDLLNNGGKNLYTFIDYELDWNKGVFASEK